MKIGFTASAFDLLHAGHTLMLEEAKAQCDCAEKSAATAYLKAIVGARMGDVAMMREGLKDAVSKDATYRREAMDDMEFAKYWESAEFKAAIQ